jgi:type II secretory pathway pseudopilin PulG
MRQARGFVRYDLWIALVIILVLAAVIVPAVLRGVQKAKLRRAAFVALEQIATAERGSYDRHHAYLDSLRLPLAGGIRLLSLQGDSTGWSASVTGDLPQPATLTCGVFEGPASLAPNPAVTSPSRIACW